MVESTFASVAEIEPALSAECSAPYAIAHSVTITDIKVKVRAHLSTFTDVSFEVESTGNRAEVKSRRIDV